MFTGFEFEREIEELSDLGIGKEQGEKAIIGFNVKIGKFNKI